MMVVSPPGREERRGEECLEGEGKRGGSGFDMLSLESRWIYGLGGRYVHGGIGGLGICICTIYSSPVVSCFVFLAKGSYSLALGLSCFIIVSATMRRWILPVAVLGMLSVKYTCISR
jgi:hypothetical protein